MHPTTTFTHRQKITILHHNTYSVNIVWLLRYHTNTYLLAPRSRQRNSLWRTFTNAYFTPTQIFLSSFALIFYLHKGFYKNIYMCIIHTHMISYQYTNTLLQRINSYTRDKIQCKVILLTIKYIHWLYYYSYKSRVPFIDHTYYQYI